MTYNSPEFDYSKYKAYDPWNFPPDRMILFAIESISLFEKSRGKFMGRRHMHPDLRFTFFFDAISLCHSTMTMAQLLRDPGRNVEWWNGQPEFKKAYKERTIQSFGSNLRGVSMSALLNGTIRLIESSMRQILWYLDQKAPENQQGFRPVWKYLLTELDALRYEPVIKLLLILRDAAINGGRFCPSLRQDLTLRFQQKDLHFVNNEEIDVTKMGYLDDWEFLFELLKEMDLLFNDLFDHPEVMAIYRMPARRYEDPSQENLG